MFAHSLPFRPALEWEPLGDHHRLVTDRASAFAEVFGWAALAGAASALHDIGKCSAEVQSYIGEADDGARRRGPNHSSAGAREAKRIYGGDFGTLLALAIAGHHAGLPDGAELEGRLARDIPRYDGWQAHAGPLPAPAALVPACRPSVIDPGFYRAFLTRMIFSCLVDADRLETAGFYARAEGGPPVEPGPTPLPILRDRLREYMAGKRAESARKAASETQARLAALRAEVLDHAVARAALKPGLFTLTVPTGGGKTLASLSFALEHAAVHGLQRVVYVIPFTGARIETAQGVEGTGGGRVAPSRGRGSKLNVVIALLGAVTVAPSRGHGSKRRPGSDLGHGRSSLPHAGVEIDVVERESLRADTYVAPSRGRGDRRRWQPSRR